MWVWCKKMCETMQLIQPMESNVIKPSAQI